ncbi:5-oxoprolinase subunit C family protein [Nocardioides donggukensis]|uniref:Biotin-dependent carboxyltransferase family protein n=1 Tax=Nocardioides donggukensis TaxID=2774019 RepID=A0A927K324_9ACTN|nr:biotin-dependent carboxyltransferase family protein [Nocardioides donggukensis]MBD8869667.1 biotin-dependent carboxyltransferase family protein [Nocardioides donggukensis]
MSLLVVDPGALSTVQDLGRLGWAHLGVPRAGALDRPAAALANRLVGNPTEAAVIETTMTGLRLTAERGHWFVVTGAPCPVRVDGVPAGHGQPTWAPAGSAVEVGAAETGVRSYVAVAGGIAVPPVLGSRSTDTLAGVGPPRLAAGDRLPVGTPLGPPQAHDTPRPATPGPLRVHPGPRADWFGPDALDRLCDADWSVAADSDRVGLRLRGEPLVRARGGELASEGMVLGSVQVPPDGQPVLFLADHPVTGGYPVVAVVPADDLHRCAQLRPGDLLRFRRAGLPA